MRGKKKLNIAVSGGRGYLGSNLIVALAKSHKVFHIDRRWQTNAPSDIDVLISLANPNEIDFRQDPCNAFQEMIGVAYELVRFVKKHNVSHLVFCSTVRIYDQEKNIYALAYETQEKILVSELKEEASKLSVLRLGNIFGGSYPTMIKRDSLVPHCFIKSALKNGRIDLLSDGNQKRDFVPMPIFEKYILKAIEDKPYGLDVVTGHPQSVRQVAEWVGQFLDVEIVRKNISVKEENSKLISAAIQFDENELKKMVELTVATWCENWKM